MNYTIQRGDTLDAIARRFGTTYQELAARNGIADPNRIEAGAQIVVPPYDQPAEEAEAPRLRLSTGAKVGGAALLVAGLIWWLS